MVDPRRPPGALVSLAASVALLGAVLVGVGAWLAVVLGPSGKATFSATSLEPLLIGPELLGRVDVPVTVRATSGGRPVWIGSAVPADATDALGSGRHEQARAVAFPARTLQLATAGEAPVEDLRAWHVWRSAGQGELVLAQSDAPESVVVYPGAPGPVEVSVTWRRSAWFIESVVVLVLGLIVLAFSGGWLWQTHRFRQAPE